MLIDHQEIASMDRKYRLNLINSITGIKPANLIGTRSADGFDNLAIISSVVHLGSQPAQLGLVMRPQTKSPKDTYLNIKNTGFYTINHVSEAFSKKAHYTSAKLAATESEFERMKLQTVFINDFPAPFVGQSAVKIGMKHLQNIDLPNGCIFVIGEVEMLSVPDEAVNDMGQLDLTTYQNVGIAGLNTYYKLEKQASYPYVRLNEIPEFDD